MTRKRCAYLTMGNTDGWAIDSDLSFEPMLELGWSIDTVPWKTAGIDWNQYDAAYICTPWDYPDDPDSFLALHETIYARCDFIRGSDSQFLLMELEVIEPSLYLRMDSQSPMRFARAFDAYVAGLRASA